MIYSHSREALIGLSGTLVSEASLRSQEESFVTWTDEHGGSAITAKHKRTLNAPRKGL